jgi:hypothetical protein
MTKPTLKARAMTAAASSVTTVHLAAFSIATGSLLAVQLARGTEPLADQSSV